MTMNTKENETESKSVSGRMQRFVSSVSERDGGWHDYLMGWFFILCGILIVGLMMSVVIYESFIS